MPWTPPVSAKSYVLRPLLEGVIRNLPSQLIPVGAFRILSNFIMSLSGPKRRGGFEQFALGDTVAYTPEQLISIWLTDGTQALGLLTDTVMYKAFPFEPYEETAWDYTTGTVTISGVTVTGLGTSWSTAFTGTNIRAGDLLRVGTEEGVIAAVNSTTSITLVAANMSAVAGASYSIHRSFLSSGTEFRDWTIIDNKVLIADGKRPIMEWDSTANDLDFWTTTAGYFIDGINPFVPAAIAAFDDRVWAANTIEVTDGTQRQRIRWSNLANPRDFHTETNYIDLPYLSGEIRRLVPMNDRLVAYFTDGVFVGIPTSFPLLPLQWNKLDTGNIGMPSQRGVIQFFGGHFFVGQDDIYYLGYGADKPERIGTPIIQEVIARCKYLNRVQTAIDVDNTCCLFGFPNASQDIAEIWYFNYKTKAWSSSPIGTKSLSSQLIYAPLTWLSLTGRTWSNLGAIYPSWDSMKTSGVNHNVYVENGMAMWKGTADGETDFGSTSIPAIVETRDFDFDAGDLTKYFVRFGVKIDPENALAVNLEFAVEVSVNRGRTWQTVDNLVIYAGEDEGYININKSGSTIRFRLSSNSTPKSYTLVEYSLRVRAGGAEMNAGLQA